MSETTWCLECWVEARQRVRADWTVGKDKEPYCNAHFRKAGYDESDGERVAPAPSKPAPPAPKPPQVEDVAADAKQQLAPAKRDLAARLEKANRGPLAEPPQKREEKSVMEKRKCENPECGKDFSPPTVRSRYCSPSCGARAWYIAKKGGAATKAKAARKSAGNGHAAPAALPAEIPTALARTATIQVTEANLDAFWAKLTIEEKATMFSMQLGLRAGA